MSFKSLLLFLFFRLLHATTRQFLHSHSHKSPLTGLQEVCGFPETQSNLEDNWIVSCPSAYWKRKDAVSFTHAISGKSLYTSSTSQFNQQNCRNCPIVGHLEVSTTNLSPVSRLQATFHADSGVYFPVSAENLLKLQGASQNGSKTHDEL